MPMGAVMLKPGVDLTRTPSLNEAGISQSQLIRFKEGLIQVYGGWAAFPSLAIPSTVRALHPWQDIPGNSHLGVGATGGLYVVTSGSNATITPQTFTTNPVPNFTTTASSFTVVVIDPNSGPSVYNSVFFNTPVAIDNLLLNGGYQITSVLSTGSYTINSSIAATAGVASSGVVPGFNTNVGNPVVTVTLPNHNFQAIVGIDENFIAPTNVDGLTISGPYAISAVLGPTQFQITDNQIATGTSSANMNGGNAQLVYYVTGGPPTVGTPFGAGTFGSGPFGGLGGSFASATGTPITATDWSLDNWGEALLACPKNGPIYIWSPESGYSNAQAVASAPFFNGGIFVSMPFQILVAWKSTQFTGVQDNLMVRWSDQEDYTNWVVSNQTTAGSFHIPTGSVIMGGLQAPNYGVIWTDIDVWIMQYVGGTAIFNFSRVGTGCGLIGQHAAGVLAGNVYWCGNNNFFMITANGVETIPCTVWDFIFQNLNSANKSKVVCAPNSVFNEIMWLFPSTNATECDSYVKLNIVSKEWDYGNIFRTAWTDASVLGNPIGADEGGLLWQHEIGEATPGAGSPSFRTGWWALTEGNDLAFIDWVLPDFKFGIFTEPTDVQINITFFVADYPGDVPRTYGPFLVTSATEYINVRMRGRLMSMLVQSNNAEWWRVGRVRFRYAVSGRR